MEIVFFLFSTERYAWSYEVCLCSCRMLKPCAGEYFFLINDSAVNNQA